ncbi:MAG: hypothetical protein RIR18_2144, partial [Pseudomonadota bacterium]
MPYLQSEKNINTGFWVKNGMKVARLLSVSYFPQLASLHLILQSFYFSSIREQLMANLASKSIFFFLVFLCYIVPAGAMAQMPKTDLVIGFYRIEAEVAANQADRM